MDLSNEVTLNADTVLPVARHTIKPIKCEWAHLHNPCNARLASWHLFHQHVLRHCRLQAPPIDQPKRSRLKREYACNLPKCSARTHSSLDALEKHVLNAHLARLQLPCPVKGCSLTFHRPNSLCDHFEDDHPTLNNRVLQLPSDLLLPLSAPHVLRVPAPPPLPRISPASSILPTIALRTSAHLAKSSDLALSLAAHQAVVDPVPQVESLESLNLVSPSLFPRFNLRKKSTSMKCLSSPQPMCNCPVHGVTPPPSILFDVFARRLERLEREKVISTTSVGGSH